MIVSVKGEKMTCLQPKLAWRYKEYPISAREDSERLKYYTKIHFNQHPIGCEDKIEFLNIPCGKCEGCALDRSNEWATRMYLEKKQWKNACFITLTYNEKNLPKDKKLHERDMTLFIKRLRKNQTGIEEWTNPQTGKKEKPIRYLYCGELGTKNKRPHYHICLFNYMPNDLEFYRYSEGTGLPLWKSKTIHDLWGKGFTPIGTLTYESACYVARYCQKKMATDENNGEFIRMSRMPGIGITEWQKNKEKLKNNGNILIKLKDKVTTKNLPRYFLKKWQEEDWQELEKFKARQKEHIFEQTIKLKEQIKTDAPIDNRTEIIKNAQKGHFKAIITKLLRKI